MPLNPLQQKLAAACGVATGVIAVLLPGFLHHRGTADTPQPLTVGVHAIAKPPANHPRAAASGTSTATASSSATASSGVTASGVTATSVISSGGQPTSAPSTTWTDTSTSPVVVATRPALPAAISDLRMTASTTSTLTLAWTASPDAVSYRLLLNGQDAGTSATASATLAWPADTTHLLVQVAAVARDGRASEWRSLVIVRPAPSSVPSTPPAPATSPSATASSSSTGDGVAPAGDSSAGAAGDNARAGATGSGEPALP